MDQLMQHYPILSIETYDDDLYLCQLANQRRLALASSPSQSNFRVYALIIVEINDESGTIQRIIDGTNSEQGYIGGSICAERSALVKLRFFPSSTVIKKIIITTDSSHPISPGILCREYIISLAPPSTPLVLASNDSLNITRCTIGSLHPYPYLYRYQTRKSLTTYTQELSMKRQDIITSSLPKECHIIYKKAMKYIHNDRHNQLHPIQFAAAVYFSNGDTEVAWQMKGFEYGCTVDAVTLLIHEIEKRRFICRQCVNTNGISEEIACCQACRSPALPPKTATPTDPNHIQPTTLLDQGNNENTDVNVKYDTIGTTPSPSLPTLPTPAPAVQPLCLIMIDQYGIAHAPFAQARALLCEYGYGDIQVTVHNVDTLSVELVRVSALVLEPPNGPLLCTDDFN